MVLDDLHHLIRHIEECHSSLPFADGNESELVISTRRGSGGSSGDVGEKKGDSLKGGEEGGEVLGGEDRMGGTMMLSRTPSVDAAAASEDSDMNAALEGMKSVVMMKKLKVEEESPVLDMVSVSCGFAQVPSAVVSASASVSGSGSKDSHCTVVDDAEKTLSPLLLFPPISFDPDSVLKELMKDGKGIAHGSAGDSMDSVMSLTDESLISNGLISNG
jgi:hypothetical protein